MIVLLLALTVSIVTQPAWAHDAKGFCERTLLASLQKENFVETLWNAPDVRQTIVRYMPYMEADSKEQLDRHLAKRHAEREMFFQVKNEKSGNYDKFVAVPVNTAVAPILKSDYDRLVNSTAPLMRFYRELLQKLYSKPNASAKDLGLDGIPEAEADLVMNVLRRSIYFEPALVHENMASYPFLTVGGFDGAIVDPKKPSTEFFETNLGTPSGLSNNGQLLDDLIWTEDLFNKWTADSKPKDDTYLILRQSIDSNAFEWTGRRGLSVVISPGIYNGAHPDVAAIARETGMPLVKSSDLYEDRDGNIRLNTSAGKSDPIVTGIYGRMEESFLLQSNADGIPMISPQYEDTRALEKKLGLKLRPGAIYDWIQDANGEITGVRRDEKGNPKFMEVWDSIGEDPARPGLKGSFARAIKNKRLYISNVGGRVVDDKRLFRIFTTYLLPTGSDLARPVKSLAPADYALYYTDPKLFVVKEPDKSGGQGIFFPRAMSEQEVNVLNARVRANPGAFEIQYVSAIATLKDARTEVPIDLRIFVMIDGKGRVRAGPNSILLRTGADGGLYTNTSRGGGYGIGYVVEDKPVGMALPLPAPKSGFQAASRASEIEAVGRGGHDLLNCLRNLKENSPKPHWENCRGQALQLSFDYRRIMDLLDPWDLGVVAKLRAFAQADDVDHTQGVMLAQIVRASLRKMSQDNLLKNVSAEDMRQLDPVELHLQKFSVKVELRRLPTPEVTYTFNPANKTLTQKVEYAEYVAVDNPEIQAIIDEVKSFGGQVRLLGLEITESTPVGPRKRFAREAAYHWINLDSKSPSYLIPVIGIDLSGDLSLAALKHELEHFRHMREIYNRNRAGGMEHAQALISAYDETFTVEGTLIGEKRAIQAEIRSELEQQDHPFNTLYGKPPYPLHYYDEGYVNRISYPEFEAVRLHLNAHKWKGAELNDHFVSATLKSLIDSTLQLRGQAIEYWEEKGDRAKVDTFRKSSVYEMLAKPYGEYRLTSSLVVVEFRKALSKACEEKNISEQDCGIPRNN